MSRQLSFEGGFRSSEFTKPTNVVHNENIKQVKARTAAVDGASNCLTTSLYPIIGSSPGKLIPYHNTSAAALFF